MNDDPEGASRPTQHCVDRTAAWLQPHRPAGRTRGYGAAHPTVFYNPERRMA